MRKGNRRGRRESRIWRAARAGVASWLHIHTGNRVDQRVFPVTLLVPRPYHVLLEELVEARSRNASPAVGELLAGFGHGFLQMVIFPSSFSQIPARQNARK